MDIRYMDMRPICKIEKIYSFPLRLVYLSISVRSGLFPMVGKGREEGGMVGAFGCRGVVSYGAAGGGPVDL